MHVPTCPRCACVSQRSLITKVCVFQFINSYISLFYVAFLKSSVKIFGETQACDKNDCLGEL